ncbi:MAG TPA: DGQHR domain-containing protein [Terriglobales bacterium]|nr:DGQHR domain-containing protein [Terriglobales bacterium]
MSEQHDDLASRIIKQRQAEEQKRSFLRELLDEYLHREDKLLVHRTRMGGSESYVASVTLAWLSEHVQFAQNLPLFKERIDQTTGNVMIDSDTLEMLNQRPLNFSRQFPMTQYLLARENHKFPPILAALNREWVDEPHADEWVVGADRVGRAVRSASDFEPLSNDGELGLLQVDVATTLYALDGQHRLLAVNGLLEFIRYGRLEEKNEKNAPTGNVLTKEQLQAEYPSLTDSYLQKLKTEKIGIEILPTVMQGESREEARHRIRRIFVHVNRMAVALDKGMMTALDEDNGFRIIAKQACTSHRLFNIAGTDGSTENLVEIERQNLGPKSEMLTTLETLAASAQLYLEYDERFLSWVPKNPALVPRRPEQEALREGLAEFSKFLDGLAELPTMRKVRQGQSTRDLREFDKDGPKHLLMRPIAQQSLAEAVGFCHFEKGMDLSVLFRKLEKIDKSGLFSNINVVESYWWGLQVIPAAAPRIKKQRRKSTVDLMIYLLGGFHDDQARIDELKELAIRERTTPPPEEVTFGFDGKKTPTDRFQLPDVITV